jgi:hypothetical protein
MSPWLVALGLGLLVGIIRGNPMGQALEDALCYVLFVLGCAPGAGRRGRRGCCGRCWSCAWSTWRSLWSACRATTCRSTARRTYHFKVILGHPLVGILLRGAAAAAQRRAGGSRAADGAIGFLIIGVIATVSRGMVLGMVLGGLTVLYVRKPARGLIIGAVAAVLVAAFAATLFELGQQYLRLGNQATVDGRVREISECLTYFTRMPVFGAGLGAEFVIDGFVVSYVHNMLAYHLWKFGLVGSALFALPLLGLARQALRIPRRDARARARRRGDVARVHGHRGVVQGLHRGADDRPGRRRGAPPEPAAARPPASVTP